MKNEIKKTAFKVKNNIFKELKNICIKQEISLKDLINKDIIEKYKKEAIKELEKKENTKEKYKIINFYLTKEEIEQIKRIGKIADFANICIEKYFKEKGE